MTAITGVSAISAISPSEASAAPGDKNAPTTYVPTAEKGAASGVATLDANAKIPPNQLPDLSTAFAQVINVKKYGALGNGIADDSAAVAAAVAAVTSAASLGYKSNLYLPPGKYMLTRLILSGVSGFSISGEGELIGLDPVNTPGVVRLINCSNFSIDGVKVRHVGAAARNAIGHGIYATGCTDFNVSASVSNVSGVGIFVGGGHRFGITKSHVSETMADGIHVTGGSTDFDVSRNFVSDTADDAIAVVSYLADGAPCSAGTISTNSVVRSLARGITVIGDDIIVSASNSVSDTRAAGIYVARESSFNTYGCHRITIAGNVIRNANTYANPTVSHASIHVSSDSAAYPIEDVTILGNTINGGRRQSILAFGYAVGAVKRVWSLGNSLSTNLGGEGVLYQQVEDGGILGNTSFLARTTGIFVDRTSSTIMVNANQVIKPNQASVANAYAIANQSSNGSTGINFPRSDATKLALLEAVNATNTAGQLQAKANFEAIQLAASATGRALLMTGSSAIAVFRSDGQLAWASGGNAGADPIDVTVARTAAGTLSMGESNTFRTGRGATESRPSPAMVGVGAMFFDVTLRKPVWSDGTLWRDAAGAIV